MIFIPWTIQTIGLVHLPLWNIDDLHSLENTDYPLFIIKSSVSCLKIWKKIWLETLPEGNQSSVPKVNFLKAKFFEILKKKIHGFSGFFGKVSYKNGKVVVFAQGLLIVCKLDSSSHACNLFDYKSWLFVKISPIFKIRSSPPRARNLGLDFYICHFLLEV